MNHFEFGDYVSQLQTASFDRQFRSMTHFIRGRQAGRLQFDALIGAASSTRLNNIDAELGLVDFDDSSLRTDYGIYLAIDGMPTGIRIDDWDARGHQFKRFFVVVDCDLSVSNQLDPGRKGISNYFAGKINEQVRELLGTRIDYSDPFISYASRHLDIGRGTSQFEPSDFQVAVTEYNQYIADDRTTNQRLVDLIHTYSALETLPHSEQEVVILFNAMLAKGIIKGYRLLYQGGSNFVYDAGLNYRIPVTAANQHPEDPVGINQVLAREMERLNKTEYVHKDHYSGRSALPELCTEFKHSVGQLLRELQGRTTKNASLIDLLVVWTTEIPPSIPSTSYTLDSIHPNRRLYHGTTHRLGVIGSNNTEIFVVSLRDVLLATTPTTVPTPGSNLG